MPTLPEDLSPSSDADAIGNIAKAHGADSSALGGAPKTPLRSCRNLAAAATAAALAAVLAMPAGAQTSDDELAAKATDPTASLMSFQLNDWYTASLHDAGGTVNQVVFRSAIPWQGFGHSNIFRVTLPFFTNTPAGRTGVGDTTVFNLTVFNQSWGRWGLGIAGSLPTGKDGLSSEKWSVGPALGFVNSSNKGFNIGLFAQTFFSFAGDDRAPDVGIINLQPIFSYQLGGGRSLSLGNSALVYDTTKSRWASLALGVNYGQVIALWGQKWRPNVEVDYDFQDRTGNPKVTLRAGFALLLPR
jgi:hypothetical protein